MKITTKSEHMRRVRSVLVNETGEGMALTKRRLSILTGLTERDVKAAVQELRQRGQPIASGNAGYWWAADPADLEEARGRIASQITQMTATLRGLELAARHIGKRRQAAFWA